MTNEEAIYCMMSYLPDDRIEHCINCPYYGCNKIDEQISICNSSEAHRMAIKALEQTTWIPVSERLPEDSGKYVVSVIDEYDKNYNNVVEAWFAHKKDYDIKESEWRALGISETVIAWMPLPEPYKGE